MSFIARLQDVAKVLFFGAPMRESRDDDTGWKRISSAPNRALNMVSQDRQQKIAVYMWRTNPLAHFIIEIMVAYLLAEGVTVSVENERAKGWLDEFWSDPVTRMDQTLPQKVRELSLFGEQVWPVFCDYAGHVRMGSLDPGHIAEVIYDPQNAAMPIGIKTKQGSDHDSLFYKIIIAGPESTLSREAQELRQGFRDGECFYFAVNALSGERGASDLLSQMDWLDGYDKALFGELERWDNLRAFIWDVSLKGADEATVRKRAAEIVVPEGGGISVHNDQETWTAVTPDLQATSGSDFARLFRNHIMGGRGLPEHWFGGGGDVNLATAGAMGEPTFKMMTMRQTEIAYMLEMVCRFAIRRRLVALGLELLADDPAYVPVVTMPEMTAKDTTSYAAALAQVATALAMAIDRSLVSDETAAALLGAVAARIGVEIDPAEELKRAREDAKERPKKDIFPGFGDDA